MTFQVHRKTFQERLIILYSLILLISSTIMYIYPNDILFQGIVVYLIFSIVIWLMVCNEEMRTDYVDFPIKTTRLLIEIFVIMFVPIILYLVTNMNIKSVVLIDFAIIIPVIARYLILITREEL